MSVITDIQDAKLAAEAEVTEVHNEIMQELEQDEVKAEIIKVWVSLPDEMKEQFKQERPQEYAALMEGIKRK